MWSLRKKRILLKVRIKIGKKGIMTADMDWGRFLVTPCALTSSHVVISKRGMAVRRGRPVEQVCNRKETT